MQRSSIIATVIAAGGILIAGSVASVAVINAASSTLPESTTVALVSQAEAPVAATAPATGSLESVVKPESLPTVAAAELPEIPIEEPAAPAADQPRSETPQQLAPQPQTAKPSPKPSRQQASQTQRKPARNTAAASPSASPSADDRSTRQISGEKAVELVLEATGGGRTESVEESTHQGYDAWAVRLTRHDGSIVTGYVERGTGVIFDWVVNQEAPAATTSAGSPESGDDDHDDDDDHEDESDDD